MPSVPKPISAAPSSGAPAWQGEWQASFREIGALLGFLELDPRRAPRPLDPDPRFPLRVPRAFAERMRKGDWDDPLLRQVLPLLSESEEKPGFASDAVGDLGAGAGPGVLRKYCGRALLVLTGVCAVHCRYCFRREFPYGEQALSRAEWEKTYDGLAEDASLEEILFSGGDPLSLSDAALRWHWERAIALPGIRRIRIHTRLPVVLPARVDASFLAMTRELAARKPLYLVLHVNHAREIDEPLSRALGALRASGAVLLNQAVLLRGVNDSPEAQAELSARLLDEGVLPYYLHQLDRVRGSHGFEVPEEEGLELMEGLRKRTSGYGVPRYVREIAGRESKTALPDVSDPAKGPSAPAA